MSTDTLTLLDGSDTTLDAYAGQALLVVNVASQCGFTRQYAGLEALYERYHDRGLTVIGVPSNQFGEQEPGTAEEIAEFCQVNFGVTFPLLAKTDVNGPDRHPLFARLTEVADATGKAGDVTWNFEKFLVSADGEVVARFRPQVVPEDPELVKAVEDQLPG
jgi:glutathione peroxidase